MDEDPSTGDPGVAHPGLCHPQEKCSKGATRPMVSEPLRAVYRTSTTVLDRKPAGFWKHPLGPLQQRTARFCGYGLANSGANRLFRLRRAPRRSGLRPQKSEFVRVVLNVLVDAHSRRMPPGNAVVKENRPAT